MRSLNGYTLLKYMCDMYVISYKTLQNSEHCIMQNEKTIYENLSERF